MRDPYGKESVLNRSGSRLSAGTISHASGHGPTLVEVFLARARRTPQKQIFSYLEDGITETGRINWEQLALRAKAVGAHLQALGLSNERVLLVFPEGLSFVEAFYGSLCAGAVAVPVPAPDLTRQMRTLPRLLEVARDAGAKAILTTADLAGECSRLRSDLPALGAYQWIVPEQVCSDSAKHWSPPRLEPEQLAYLQYTSGSTREPKGVMLSHRNILAHAMQLQAHYRIFEDDVEVSWMPHFHDYALLEAIILPVYAGAKCYLMSPRTFLKRPLRWLEAIDRYGAIHTQGPNFAYDYCVRRISPEHRKHLDLSRWRTASVGAEPIRIQTLERFYEAFRDCGLRKETLAPSYGLAEATLLVSTSWQSRTSRHVCLDGDQLEKGLAVEVSPETPRSRWVAHCGQVLEGVEVAIVDPHTCRRQKAATVGEIWIRSPGVALGYWNRPLESEKTFNACLADSSEGPFLRSGDLGVLLDGCLYLTGRLKDLIIIAGRNHYPQDLEYTAEMADEALRSNAAAAFGLEIQGHASVGLALEVNRGTKADRYPEIVTGVMGALGEEYGVPIGAVVLLRPGSVPKTSSGKIQRQLSRKMFERQQWTPLYHWTHPNWAAVWRHDQDSPPESDPRPVAKRMQADLVSRQH